MDEVKPGVSDEAVKAKTGKNWSEWFAILDAAGARKMDHKAIVAYLVDEHEVGSWWRQMVTVTYEQARGLREKHENPQGFQISRSKTLDVPVERLYAAWKDAGQRAAWLPDPAFTIRSETANKILHILWIDGQSSVDVAFYVKGPSKTQIALQHSKLKSAAQGEAMKSYWSEALDRLAAYLAG